MQEIKPWMSSQDKWQYANGIKPKTFKISESVAKQFAEACQAQKISQAKKISELMQKFIDDTLS